MATRIGMYTLRIMGPDPDPFGKNEGWDQENQKVIDGISDALSQAEDAIDDQLPEGYYCKIEE